MRLVDYLLGIPIQLRSPLPGKVLAAQINGAASSSFNPFAMDVVGGAYFGFVKLGVSEGFIDYRGKPILTGRIHDAAGGSELHLRYGATLPVLAGLSFLTVIFLIMFGLDDGFVWSLIGLAVLSVLIQSKFVPDDFDELLLFLSNYAEASPFHADGTVRSA